MLTYLFFKRSGSSLKPVLTENNKAMRILHCLNEVQTSTSATTKFNTMRNQVHIDEKWFYMKQVKKKCMYLLKRRNLYNKHNLKNLRKVMFLVAVA